MINDSLHNIWNCVECEAWSHGYNYEDYLYLFEQRKEEHISFSEDGYEALCAVFEAEMKR